VAKEIDIERGRYIVFGRCLFTGNGTRYVGVEHPAEYKSHFDQLAIWARGYNTIPQPSVFWHRTVWLKCGGFNESDHHVLDYDLFCRFSRYFFFHKVDELWSTFRMHDDSKSSQRTEAEVLEMSIRASRRYWRSWFSPLRWRCEFSHWLYGCNGHEKARHHARLTEQAVQSRRYLSAIGEFLRTFIYSPKMAKDRLLMAWLADRRIGIFQRLLKSEHEFTGHYGDLWIGPLYRTDIEVPAKARRLVLTCKHTPHGSHVEVRATLSVNRRLAACHNAAKEELFTLSADVAKYRGQRCQVEVRSGPFFVPRLLHNTPDDRRLVIQLLETKFESD
jgi:hypothetical protein